MSKKLEIFILNKIKTSHMIILSTLTLLFLIIMNVSIFPKITATTNGIKVFDVLWFTGYSYDTACTFLSSIGNYGNYIYTNIQLPLDFVFIFLYPTLLFLTLVKIFKKLNYFTASPLLLIIIDFAENICIYLMLTNSQVSKSLVLVSSCLTICKSVLLVALIFIAIIYLVINLITNKNAIKYKHLLHKNSNI